MLLVNENHNECGKCCSYGRFTWANTAVQIVVVNSVMVGHSSSIAQKTLVTTLFQLIVAGLFSQNYAENQV